MRKGRSASKSQAISLHIHTRSKSILNPTVKTTAPKVAKPVKARRSVSKPAAE